MYEEALGVKYFRREEGRWSVAGIDVTAEEAPANSVPAAAVMGGVAADDGITGRKAHAGGLKSDVKSRAQPGNCIRNWQAKSCEVTTV